MRLKIIVFIFIIIISIGCDNPVEQSDENGPLVISFKNNTGFQLKNILVDNKPIGNLQSESSTKYFAFDTFTFDTGMPDENASAEINEETFTNHLRGFWCGTEKITINSGKYLIEIAVVDTVLFLICRNAPRI